VSKRFSEWYQKTNKTEDTNKVTVLAFKIIAILHNTRLATFIKLLETVSRGLFRNQSQNSCQQRLTAVLRTARRLETIWRQILWGNESRGQRTCTGRVWAAGFHHVTARSAWRVLKLTDRLFLQFSIFYGQR
jgi:hypothetical protein